MGGLVAVLLFAASDPAAAQSTQVFSDVESRVSTFNSSVTAVVRVIGIAGFLVGGVIMVVTQRIQLRFLGALAVGLLLAAFAEPAVAFLFGS